VKKSKIVRVDVTFINLFEQKKQQHNIKNSFSEMTRRMTKNGEADAIINKILGK
jgi:hypothetical protein